MIATCVKLSENVSITIIGDGVNTEGTLVIDMPTSYCEFPLLLARKEATIEWLDKIITPLQEARADIRREIYVQEESGR